MPTQTGRSDEPFSGACFGQLRLGAGLPSDRLFTGQTRHNVLGSGNAGNDAYYLFQAADTVVPVNTDPKSLRALNRYAYSLNNPLKLVDPAGHFSTDQLKQWGYSQDQINAWAKNDPLWAAIVAAAQVGDVVTGLDPFTSGAPQTVTARFQVLPIARRRAAVPGCRLEDRFPVHPRHLR